MRIQDSVKADLSRRLAHALNQAMSPEGQIHSKPATADRRPAGRAASNVVDLNARRGDNDSHERMEAYLGRPGWDGLDAVKARAVHAVYHGGARTLYDFAFLQYIAKTLHPETFADIDPQANLDAFFRDYMPTQFTGTYMTKLP